jgi:glutamine synthetase
MSEGVGFDGSSIRGFQEIQESDCWSCPTRPRPFSTHSRRQRRWS